MSIMRPPQRLLIGIFLLLTVCSVYFYHNGKVVHWDKQKGEQFLSNDIAVRLEKVTNETVYVYQSDDQCKSLLHHGNWMGNVWKPRDCTLHKYTRSDAAACIRKRAVSNPGHNVHVVFIGDSRIQELFYQAKSYFKNGVKRVKNQNDGKDFFPSLNLTIEYMLRQWTDDNHANEYKKWTASKPGDGRPDIIVAGCAAWMIRYYLKDKPRDEAFKKYKDELQNNIFPYMKQLADLGTRIIWKLQDPVVEAHLGPDKNRQLLTNQQFNLYNQAAIEIFNGSNIEVWNVSRIVASHFLHNLGDGVHFRHNTSCQDQHMQILFNVYCDPVIHLSDTMCCKNHTVIHKIASTIRSQPVPINKNQLEPRTYSVSIKMEPMTLLWITAVFAFVSALFYWCEKYVLREDPSETKTTASNILE